MTRKQKARTSTPAAALPGQRVLVMSHMHPAVSHGGAEIAAYQLYGALRASSEVAACWFLAASGGKVAGRLGARLSQPFGPDEYVYSGAGFDHFIHANPDPEWPGELTRLLTELRPDVIHLHHHTNFGVETLLTIRQALPEARIILTLHEYLAICNHFGQMVKRPSLALCNAASPRDCHRCFPERTEQDFFLRELYIKRFFRLVDRFISPSQFLADRYAAWGIDAERIVVIENGMPAAAPPTPRVPDCDLTLGFFGQISRLKGIDVLFDAAILLEKAGTTGLRIEVHGDHSGQPPEFRALFEARIKDAPPNIELHGPYANGRVGALMARMDAVLVPSIWWENSPLVIQEAFRAGRPVICSDIGGLAEKVRDGVDGFHFAAGSPRSLAALLTALARAPDRLRALSARLATPPGLDATLAATLGLYRANRAHAPQLEVRSA
ncbi:glycosyltransferase family 4 protein [Plastoroseomonas arctica]|uniref:Glycosyltransferase family 4 protein n=1 Tax=Plastoroseomonas arctica TaxID=1509237 RepID=A0AAF1JY97_9PROT|nr:glycosyltransferase family 4 protein [Plastoroseomonas arctica]MBR0656779.1 glycosyltransferase family 4 protein [Plastoroseomonas arctica]